MVRSGTRLAPNEFHLLALVFAVLREEQYVRAMPLATDTQSCPARRAKKPMDRSGLDMLGMMGEELFRKHKPLAHRTSGYDEQETQGRFQKPSFSWLQHFSGPLTVSAAANGESCGAVVWSFTTESQNGH